MKGKLRPNMVIRPSVLWTECKHQSVSLLTVLKYKPAELFGWNHISVYLQLRLAFVFLNCHWLNQLWIRIQPGPRCKRGLDWLYIHTGIFQRRPKRKTWADSGWIVGSGRVENGLYTHSLPTEQPHICDFCSHCPGILIFFFLSGFTVDPNWNLNLTDM